MKKIALIDGYGFVFRAYHSLPSLSRNDGTPVGAVFGFTNMLLKLIASLEVSHIAVVFDSGSKTFRNDIYPQYKANRPPCPEDLIPQFSIVRECAEALNISILEKIGFEADDIIATIAKKSALENYEVIIVSSDKDLMQLIDGKISMYDAMKNKIIKEKEVYEKFLVNPSQLLDTLALIGDSADNVPGVKSIGPKTASELINQFENLDNLYHNLHLIKQEKRRLALLENKDSAFLSKKLIKLDENVELKITLEDLKCREIEPHKLIKFLEYQGFKSLIYKVKKEFNLPNQNILPDNLVNNLDDSKNLNHLATNSSNDYSLNKIDITSYKIIEEIHSKAQISGKIIIDYSIIDNKFDFISLTCVKPDNDFDASNIYEIYYYDFNSSKSIDFVNAAAPANQEIDLLNFNYDISVNNLENNLSKTTLSIGDFDKILFDNSIKKVFYDSKNFFKYYLNFYKEENLVKSTLSMVFDDINLINYLANSAVKNSLRELIDKNLNIDFEELGYGEKLEIIHKNHFSKNFSAEYLKLFQDDKQKIDFFCLINYAIFKLYQIFFTKISELKLYNCYLRLELPLLQVLNQIENNGIKIDIAKLNNLGLEFKQKIENLTTEIYQMSGCEFNIASSKQLSEVLFSKLGIQSSKKSKKTKELSTNVKVLEDLALEGYNIANKIIEYRKFTKLKNTYCDSLPKQISTHTNRIHTTLSSTATLTGRLSSVNPNLQNIPIKSLEGKKIRECFIAEKNNLIISADYSQIELRILAHLAQLPNLIEAFNNNKDIHKITASEIFGVEEILVSEEMRAKAKAINFGIIYGISAFGLARQLRISNKEASNYIKSYFEKYLGIKEHMQKSIDLARKNGYVETISSRKCFINEINNKNPIIRQEAERQAINAPIQGSAADIIKKAMIQIQHRFIKEQLKSKLILQIHDELLVEATPPEVEIVKNILSEEMSNSYKISVALKIDFSIKNSW